MRPSLSDASRDLALGSTCTGCGRPGRVLCAGCRAALPSTGAVAWPTPVPPGLVVPFAGGPYDGLLRALVLDHKEHGVLALAEPLGAILAGVVTTCRRSLGADDRPVVLVPVPSRSHVVRSRGHDPLLRVVRSAAATLRRHGVATSVVRGLRPTGRVLDQAGLAAAQRAANLHGSLRPRQGVSVRRDALVLVADDVLTTGATAREAQRALEQGRVPVHGVVTVAATVRWAKHPDPAGSLVLRPPGN